MIILLIFRREKKTVIVIGQCSRSRDFLTDKTLNDTDPE